MPGRYHNSKYSAQRESEIRYNILAAIQELATFNGVDIATIKETSPYSIALSGVTPQKIAAELKKLVDCGMVVKGVVRGKTVKYMLRGTYNDLIESGKINNREFGYGDYRDDRPSKEDEEEYNEKLVYKRIKNSASRPKYQDMW